MKIKDLNRSKSIVFTEVDDSAILLNTISGKYIELNKSGKIIWDLIKNGSNYEDLLFKLKNNFEYGNENDFINSIESFLLNCHSLNIIDIDFE